MAYDDAFRRFLEKRRKSGKKGSGGAGPKPEPEIEDAADDLLNMFNFDRTRAVIEALTLGLIDVAKVLTGVPQNTSDTEFLSGVWFSVTFWYILRKTQVPENLAGSFGGIAGTTVEAADVVTPLT